MVVSSERRTHQSSLEPTWVSVCSVAGAFMLGLSRGCRLSFGCLFSEAVVSQGSSQQCCLSQPWVSVSCGSGWEGMESHGVQFLCPLPTPGSAEFPRTQPEFNLSSPSKYRPLLPMKRERKNGLQSPNVPSSVWTR